MEVVRWHRNSEQLEMFRDGKLSVYFSGSQKVHLMAGLGTGFKIRIENSYHTFMLWPWLSLCVENKLPDLLVFATKCHPEGFSYQKHKICFHASLSTHPLYVNFILFQCRCELENILKIQFLVFNFVKIWLWMGNIKRPKCFLLLVYDSFTLSFQIKYRCWTVPEFETAASWWSCYEFPRSRNQVLANVHRLRCLDSIYHSFLS